MDEPDRNNFVPSVLIVERSYRAVCHAHKNVLLKFNITYVRATCMIRHGDYLKADLRVKTCLFIPTLYTGLLIYYIFII